MGSYFGYIINVILAIVYCVCGIIFANKVLVRKNPKIVNKFFLVYIVFFYFANIILSILPLNGLNLKLLTPISNISPLLFCLSFVALFLCESDKQKIYKLFCLFFVPMFVAGITTSAMSFVGRSTYFLLSLADMCGHITFSLFCYYLIKTKQVKLNLKDLLVNVANVYIILVFVIILNLIFNTDFFGLNFYGMHNIYLWVFTEYGWVSNTTYILGLTVIMFGGYYVLQGIQYFQQRRQMGEKFI